MCVAIVLYILLWVMRLTLYLRRGRGRIGRRGGEERGGEGRKERVGRRGGEEDSAHICILCSLGGAVV